MIVKQVLVARSIWLFDVFDLNPLGLSLFPFVEALGSRYRFAKVPSRIDDFDFNKEVIYEEGRFETPDGPLQADLSIYHNGLVATTRHSTEAADTFLEDLLYWAAEDHRLAYSPGVVKRRTYLSTVEVECNRRLASICDKLGAFAQGIQAVESSAGQPLRFELGGFVLRHDPIEASSPLAFTFERREGKPFSEHRYHSSAPVSTSEHIELLSKLEALMED